MELYSWTSCIASVELYFWQCFLGAVFLAVFSGSCILGSDEWLERRRCSSDAPASSLSSPAFSHLWPQHWRMVIAIASTFISFYSNRNSIFSYVGFESLLLSLRTHAEIPVLTSDNLVSVIRGVTSHWLPIQSQETHKDSDDRERRERAGSRRSYNCFLHWPAYSEEGEVGTERDFYGG